MTSISFPETVDVIIYGAIGGLTLIAPEFSI